MLAVQWERYMVYSIMYAKRFVVLCFALFWFYLELLGIYVMSDPYFSYLTLAPGQSRSYGRQWNNYMTDTCTIHQWQITGKHHTISIVCTIRWVYSTPLKCILIGFDNDWLLTWYHAILIANVGLSPVRPHGVIVNRLYQVNIMFAMYLPPWFSKILTLRLVVGC